VELRRLPSRQRCFLTCTVARSVVSTWTMASIPCVGVLLDHNHPLSGSGSWFRETGHWFALCLVCNHVMCLIIVVLYCLSLLVRFCICTVGDQTVIWIFVSTWTESIAMAFVPRVGVLLDHNHPLSVSGSWFRATGHGFASCLVCNHVSDYCSIVLLEFAR
jgi:hypothetical protein